METLQLLRLLHLIGFGLLSASTLGGWLIFQRYIRLEDRRSKIALLGATRGLGLLSPVGIVVMAVTGIGQMHMYGLGLFTQPWLSAKLLLFLIAAAAGIVFSIRSRARTRLVSQLAEGGAPDGAEEKVARFDGQIRVFYLLQTTLLTAMLLLAVTRPGL